MKSPYVQFNITKQKNIVLIFVFSENIKIKVPVGGIEGLRHVVGHVNGVLKELEQGFFNEIVDEE